MKKTRTPFDILGVSPADDMTVIRMAWRRKVRQYHPDQAFDKSAATAELAEINAAFDALQGHVPKGAKKKAAFQKKKPCAPKAKVSPKSAKSAEQPKPEAPPVSPQHARTETLRRKSMSRLSAEMQDRSKRARAGYAQARSIVAVA